MPKPITEYDPTRCATMRELRMSGFPIPTEIPDAAWVPRRAIGASGTSRKRDAKGRLRVEMELRLREPIRLGDVIYQIDGSGRVVEKKA